MTDQGKPVPRPVPRFFHVVGGELVPCVPEAEVERLREALGNERVRADEAVADLRALIEDQAAEIKQLRDKIERLCVVIADALDYLHHDEPDEATVVLETLTPAG